MVTLLELAGKDLHGRLAQQPSSLRLSHLGGGNLAIREECLGAIAGRVRGVTEGDASTCLGGTPEVPDAVREGTAAGVSLAALGSATGLVGFGPLLPAEGPDMHVNHPLHLPFAVYVKHS